MRAALNESMVKDNIYFRCAFCAFDRKNSFVKGLYSNGNSGSRSGNKNILIYVFET